MKNTNLERLVKDQLYNLAAGFLYALSICYFVKGAGFAPGGISGIALILNHILGLPVGTATLACNIPLIILSYRFLGRAFLMKTIVSILYCTVFQDAVFSRIECYQGDPLLAALFAGVLLGGALALLYMRGSSSGGGDFLTLSIKVLRPHFSVGTLTGTLDVVIILLGWAVYGSVDAVLYGLVMTAVTSVVIDKTISGNSMGKMLLIITSKGPEITKCITEDCDCGATIIPATGAYTGSERNVFLCACARPEVYKIRSAVYAIDPKCMVMIAEAGEVYGEGFSDPAKRF